jgi:aspartate-semialdehyde dehydrogenase
VACSLAAAFAELRATRLVCLFFQPVSERGQEGVDELESQTTKLLTLQPLPQSVFDAQVAFNLLDRWGPDSAEKLSDVRAHVVQEVGRYLGGRTAVPALTLIQAPVFFGYGFAAFAEFTSAQQEQVLTERLAAAGFHVSAEDDPGPSNVSVAGETQPAIGRPQADPNSVAGYWFWGAADNLRVGSVNAVRIAESLLAL